jgi:hypothetical protein
VLVVQQWTAVSIAGQLCRFEWFILAPQSFAAHFLAALSIVKCGFAQSIRIKRTNKEKLLFAEAED